jgi:hypothetical protein
MAAAPPNPTPRGAPDPGPPDAPDRLPSRWRRRLRWAGGVLGLLLLLVAAFLHSCFAQPPDLPERPAVLDAVAQVDSAGRARLGRSWFLRREGASLLHLEGDPYALGYANGRLTADLMQVQERELIGTVRRFFPSTPGFWGIATLVLVNNRSLPDHVPLEYQLEVRGLAEGSTDPFPEWGYRYHRLLNYHAAHDIAHWVWDKPVVACTALAARGGATASGRLLTARNFDFEAGRHFDANKVIALYRPSEGQAFLSVSWPGMAGAVTGLNAARIFISINGAHSVDRGRIGTPVSLVIRRVLQYATSLEEAVAIVRDAQVFVTDGYLIADGETGEAVVVEKSPARTAVRPMEGDLLLQTNHFEAAEFQQDPGNLAHQAVGTTCARRARLEELVTDRATPLDPAALVEVLRDRKGVGGVELGLGNRAAINALIATHSVVCDVTGGTLWVSRGPYVLGQYDAYRIDAFGEGSRAPIPADPLAATDAAARVEEARALLARAAEDPGRHLNELRRVLELLPDDPRALQLLGEGLLAAGRDEEARGAWTRCLEVGLPFPGEAEALRSRLAELGGASPR